MNTTIFDQFFIDCVGNWQSDRTYHYLTHREIERSQTTFEVEPLTSDRKVKVLSDNNYGKLDNLESLPGFNLGFYTISEAGEEKRQNLNLMFVPKSENSATLEGDYLRDSAYEENRPIVSHFSFNSNTRELLMTTNYTRVVSVDSITLTNPTLRIRKILNYEKPPAGKTLKNVLLVGFGVEQKIVV
ncbi:phycobiliprotein lyase [Waterburya agarophytonicola K14]|uniref:Chromophore lyase CpcS/CpeS n=1 Tax=Waterburya agarophytonicola KI4 TaxID=2874699 RepID=A0A964BTQ4_9CYAN|nr:phycobiliprotein lyase [Waterburya agarophytonicola]MCC0178343.1 phycobiliprotein lyase [Waterburya agarophytonicola KI4]